MPRKQIVFIFLSFFLFLFSITAGSAIAVYGISWSIPTPPSVPHNHYSPPVLTPFVIPSITIVASQAPSPTITPRPTVQITKAPTNTPTPTRMQSAQSTVNLSSQQQYILDGINAYRKSQGLTDVTADSSTCTFASTRANEITTSFSHDGFQNRINNHTLPYPSYRMVTENIAMTSDYTQVVPMWIASAGHAANMRANTPYVCVAQSGNYFAYEGWNP